VNRFGSPVPGKWPTEPLSLEAQLRKHSRGDITNEYRLLLISIFHKPTGFT
jgi:hypothetical protein